MDHMRFFFAPTTLCLGLRLLGSRAAAHPLTQPFKQISLIPTQDAP